MAILSKRMVSDVGREYFGAYGLRARLVDVRGRAAEPERDVLGGLDFARRRRDYALQQSVSLGQAYVFRAAPEVVSCVVALEDRRMVHGGLVGGEVLVGDRAVGHGERLEYLVSRGMEAGRAARFLSRLPAWSEDRAQEAARFLQETFYQISGWKPELMRENRLRLQQHEQISQAIEDQRRSGRDALYAFEKERMLLASAKAGDRSGARRILNEMLATIYMSSPQLVVLRARTIELVSCLTRAAIEDNPLMEPLIERNHAWTDRLVRARSFEDLSHELMGALDEFIDGLYLHGMNRSNTSVRRALDIIGKDFAGPLGLTAVARQVGLSPGRLARLVKEFTGRTVLQVIHEVRVRHAQQLLERTSKSCAEVAYETGFGDQSYFIKQFRRLTGTTPARYRSSLHRPPSIPSPDGGEISSKKDL